MLKKNHTHETRGILSPKKPVQIGWELNEMISLEVQKQQENIQTQSRKRPYSIRHKL